MSSKLYKGTSNRCSLLKRMLRIEPLESRTLLASDVIFAEPVRYAAGPEPADVTVSDVNDDGIMDLVAGDFSGDLTVLLGNGDGTFNRSHMSADFHGWRHTVGDFDGDGDVDVVAAVRVPGTFNVALNLGSVDGQWNGFSESIVFGPEGNKGAGWAEPGDLDGDGDLDALVSWNNGSLWVILNKGSSNGQWNGFAEPVIYPDPGNSVKTRDVDQDGVLDIVFGRGQTAVQLGKGDGTFGGPARYAGGGSIVDDLDGDGDLDAAGAFHLSNNVTVILGNGDGTFEEFDQFTVRGKVGDMTSGDFDSDGDVDLATVGRNQVWLLINEGDGTFFEQEESFSFESRLSGSLTTELTAEDLDGDGDMDLAVAASYDGSRGVHVFLNISGEIREAVWDGSAEIGEVGDGATWGDPNNWSVDGVHDELPAADTPGDNVTFPASFAEKTIQLGQDRIVRSVNFEANVALTDNALTVTSGEVTVAPDITAAIHYDDKDLIKRGDGTLIVNGTVANAAIEAGTLRGSGTFNEIVVERGATLFPSATTGPVTVTRDTKIEGTLLIEFGDGVSDLLEARTVTLEPGSTLQLRALSRLGPTGDKLENPVKALRITGTFTHEPAVGMHVGSGVFTKEIAGTGSPVAYSRRDITVSVFQAAAGDANGDGQFDQLDLVEVLQGGKYLTGQPSEWTEGDWSGDGVFDQLDIVAALAEGNYKPN